MPTQVDPNALAIVLLLAAANNRIVEYFVTPVFERKQWDKTYLMYAAGLTGFALGLMTDVDLFTLELFIHPAVGHVLTALLIAGGSNFIHDLLDARAPSISASV